MTSEADFFNRAKEIRDIRAILDNDPGCTVVLGGPSSGKTRLLKHVLSSEEYAPIILDLRDSPVNNYQQLMQYLMMQVPVWANLSDLMGKIASNVKQYVAGTEITVGDATLKLPANWPSKELTVTDFAQVLSVLKSALPTWTLLTGSQRKPVLFIDEANLLGALSKAANDEGAVALHNLLRWCVSNSKQERRFHVVFASSDSFFLNWLQAQGIRDHVDTVVIGDLDRDHARGFYEDFLARSGHGSSNVPPFDEVYNICGGHMLSIKKYLNQALASNQGKDFKFRGLYEARAMLRRMVPSANTSDKPWSRKHIRAIFEEIYKTGWIRLDDAETLTGVTEVRALIDADVVHYRPIRPLVEDLAGQPDEEVLTARTPVQRAAMGLIFAKESLAVERSVPPD